MKNVKWGRGVCNFLPVAAAAALIAAALLQAAVVLLVRLAVLLSVSVLIFNPWKVLDPLIDGKTRGLWAAGITTAAAAVLCWLPLGWKARAVLGGLSLLCFWLGWMIRKPAAPGPAVIVQSKEGDNVIGQLHAKVNGNGLQRWQDGGKNQARAVLHQAFSYFVSEEELDGTGRVSFALGYEMAHTKESELRAKVEYMEKNWWKLTDSTREAKELSERVAELEHIEWEKDCLIDELQRQLIAAQNQIPTVIDFPTAERDEEIRRAVAAGETQSSVAARYGLSRQRVHQIANAK